MAIFKCKMCGGTIEFNQGDTVGICDSCGTKQTLPRLDDDKKANLYDRANHFRRNNDYDKAMGIYEQILNVDSTDAEAYWSLVLCRYGIEYVEDPATHKRVPTVNRAQFTSIFDDDNYKSALKYADPGQKVLYEEEAKTINEIQKGILAISQKEEPFDVFICYKETDNNGRRTQDSVLANDLYHQLTQEGFKVFFSRITLEDKLGTAYEPYIFAALNSAKVMVVIGTKPEYFNAVWVKNEWSRYLALIRNGAKKMLIPAYRDMDPYDLPEEFSHLQAQDMSKLGFMQDLIRGIKKITGEESAKETPKETAKETVIVKSDNANITPLLKRAFMFLEDGDWSNADEYCEKVLDLDPENAGAYLGKLMAKLRVKKQEELRDAGRPFDRENAYQKVMRFAEEPLKSTLTGYLEHIRIRNENERLQELYDEATELYENASTSSDYEAAAETYDECIEFKDSAIKKAECLKQAEACRKKEIYEKAVLMMNDGVISQCEAAIQEFQRIPGYRDVDEQISFCQKEIEELKEKKEAERLERERKEETERLEREKKAEEERIVAEKARLKRKKVLKIATPVICVCIAFVFILTTVIIPNSKYKEALALYDAEKYEEAIVKFEEISTYKDSESYIEEAKYKNALMQIDSGDYVSAYTVLESLGAYKDSQKKRNAIKLDYKKQLLEKAEVGDIVKFGSYEQDNDISNGKETITWKILEKKKGKALLISEYALDCKPYNTEGKDVTWEISSIRRWLNEEFMQAAFSKSEQKLIAEITVKNPNNNKFGTKGGKNTQDKIFLLSIAEAETYFASDEARACAPTAYAVANGAYQNYVTGNCWWWLRSPGYDQDNAAGVVDDGGVLAIGRSVGGDYCAVRPALWVNLES